MFIVALFTIAKIWKQPKCPSVDEWIKGCGTFIQWNTMQQQNKKKLFFLCNAVTFCNSMDGPGEYYAK